MSRHNFSEEYKNYNYMCVEKGIEDKIFFIDRYGYIYPDCRPDKYPSICHLTDPEAVSKVNKAIWNTEEGGLYNCATIELCSFCHAKCYYCFQEDGARTTQYAYFKQLMNFLCQLKIKWTFFAGGEILDQPQSMDFMREYRLNQPDAWIHLKTNGNAKKELVPFIRDVCDSIMVSFNGFSPTSTRLIMDVDVNLTKDFCLRVKNETDTNLGIKYLLSPVTVVELHDFLQWGLSVNPKSIVIQTVYKYIFENAKSKRIGSSFDGLDPVFWQPVYQRVAEKIDALLQEKREIINLGGLNSLSGDREFINLLPMKESTKSLFFQDGVYRIE